ncbi:gamma-glutamyltranspeptidase/glutathione hydrolase [Natronocella acetinitrilica]|uniref:Gamma-glutamyltranspeptidase/glutathione hydrolase n=1 Tax=Natronocella acetinitrilica TaxID=414046 RepID=A0AAE3G4K4_9GAMM|nr:gamma-glutamyltransferase [Natronocella acetinitrilica]MCP1675053.1 gamma-glutamyltranspeptidase/glutathione hydrolase [Natronocella acetinitrilica]
MKANTQPLRAAVVAPHHLAAEAGAGVLGEGGNALEAMVAAAASIAVVYPHMNSIGGDGFWLIQEPGRPPLGIDASGVAAALATPAWYRERGETGRIPHRGGLAANTVAGTIAGWSEALDHSRWRWGGTMPLSRLLAPAIAHAGSGITVTRSQAETLSGKQDELVGRPEFDETFLIDGRLPEAGDHYVQSHLADVLRRLVNAGLDDFYRGEIATMLAAGLEAAGSPLRLSDLQNYRAHCVRPLVLDTAVGALQNMPPPTQGLASILILGLYQQISAAHPHKPETLEYLHALVESTKLAFRVRDRVVTDPSRLPEDPMDILQAERVAAMAREFDPQQAAPWPPSRGAGDTVWLGAVDAQGRSVSFIQSTYHEFGSGIVAPGSGVVWQNRGCSFDLDETALNALGPGRRPFHTLNPAIAQLGDGRTVVYGTMGGEGQPQTQAAIFTRAILHGYTPEQAVAAPRWLLGRTWGSGTDSLKIEDDMPAEVIDGMRRLGHLVDVVPACNSMMGHAGMLILDADGGIIGASDPRCDGAVAGVN